MLALQRRASFSPPSERKNEKTKAVKSVFWTLKSIKSAKAGRYAYFLHQSDRKRPNQLCVKSELLNSGAIPVQLVHRPTLRWYSNLNKLKFLLVRN